MSKPPPGPVPRRSARWMWEAGLGSQSLLNIGKFRVGPPGYFLKCTEPQGPPWRQDQNSLRKALRAGQEVLLLLPLLC